MSGVTIIRPYALIIFETLCIDEYDQFFPLIYRWMNSQQTKYKVSMGDFAIPWKDLAESFRLKNVTVIRRDGSFDGILS